MARDTFENKDEMDQPVYQKEGLGNALVYLTALVLVIAFVMMQQVLAKQYNAGMFMDAGSPSASK